MSSRKVGAFALTACALRASAFLIPPGLDDKAGALTNPGILNAKSFALQLPCSECAFTTAQEATVDDVEEDKEPMFWIQGGANNVVVNLTISEDGERLQVNGETIFPLGWSAQNLMAQRIYVNQVPANTPLEDIAAGKARMTPLEVTGSGVSVMEEELVSPEGHALIPIKHNIFELETQPVSLDSISITILKTSAGELFIAHVETEERSKARPDDFFGPPPEEEMPEGFLFPPHFGPYKGKPGPPHGAIKECKMLPESLCKLRNMLEDKIMGMRHGMRKGGCRGRKHHGLSSGKLPGHIKPHFLRPGFHQHDAHAEEDGVRHHGRPHHMRPHGHHGHPDRHGHFMHSFSRGLAAVLIPTMAGIAVGMTVSLVGLVIGRLIGFLWIKFYRRGRRGYQSVRLQDDHTTIEAENEKVIIIEDVPEVDPLPVYEEAPAYEEAAKEQK
ncbi:hypothetical protein AC578_7885 [Pseudocercospora eumusae]|uniref:Uncharacterized protein n=1 Tax=Pseudocercospora eumusae TaxID=321146 RepID=A0A139H070_9PEZI|nr:hypothetical protein AC578_7885 [Pseudocercospora eumusae]